MKCTLSPEVDLLLIMSVTVKLLGLMDGRYPSDIIGIYIK